PPTTVPNLRTSKVPRRSRTRAPRSGGSPPACATEGGPSRLHCPYRRRSTLNGARPAGSIDPAGSPAWPPPAIADHLRTRPRDAPTERIRRQIAGTPVGSELSRPAAEDRELLAVLL